VKINESDEMEKAVNELAQEVDVVQAEFPYAGQYIEKLKLKKILDEHNVESDILKNQYRYEQSLIRKAFSFLQYRKMLKFEKTLCMKMDIILATSEEDKKILETFNKNVFVVPNGTDVLQDYIEDKGNKIITYIGLMSYRANVDAMLFFSQDIWPLIKNEEPAAKLLIVGKNPTEEIKALAKGDVFVTGEVENVMQYLRDTSVFIAPIRIGSGTRIKILEAMACGKPVVSTRLGCAGLEVQDGNDIFISDGPKQFAQRVLDLMGNKEERIRIGQNALNLVKDRYTWDQIGNKLEKVYQNAI
jgi:glycosyltransferase involved in cell wall biosynthesis